MIKNGIVVLASAAPILKNGIVTRRLNINASHGRIFWNSILASYLLDIGKTGMREQAQVTFHRRYSLVGRGVTEQVIIEKKILLF